MTVFLLSGAQTDFARRWSRDGGDLPSAIHEVMEAAVRRAQLSLADVDVTHVGNFAAERFRGQGHLGGFVASADPALVGKPASRHEAACASGSVAALAAMADVDAGYYDLACVVGIEEMRNVPGDEAAAHLGAAAWVGREAEQARYVWPFLFSELLEAVDRRSGVRGEHLWAFARQAFENGRRNPDAQTRRWNFEEASFTADDAANPPIEGRLRRQDCAQVTDGAAAVLFASERFARAWAGKRGIDLEQVPRILGWGHGVGPMSLAEKLSEEGPYLFPHVKAVSDDARRRAGADVSAIDLVELHDCFTITAYVLLEHLGITPPGKAFEAIEDGRIARDGSTPVNVSGGLIGLGHPVGATGVRMLFDAWRQVCGFAGEMQLDDVRRVQTLNIGGSATTAVSFVVGR
ncbi:MAG: acetyl-CoA acetyltransferase [Myxococcota bacterium]